MTSLWQAPAIVVVITWLSAPPGTLGNAARQEALRRSMMPQSVMSLSIYDWLATSAATEPGAAAPQPALASPPAAAPRPAIDPSGAPLPGVSLSDESRRDEAWWRARMAAARAALERSQTLADAVQSHINSLRTDVVNRDDPAQQSVLRQQLANAVAELERLKGQIATDRRAILAIQDDARRLGVPAEWIRDDVIFSGRSP